LKIRDEAREMLERAGDRAASLGASHEAQRYLEQAASLCDVEEHRAQLIERAGEMAIAAGRLEEAKVLLNSVLEAYESKAQSHAAARVTARLAEADWAEGRIDEAVERMERAFAVLSEDAADEDLATLAAQVGRLHYFRGEPELSADRLETALEIAEELWLPEVMSQALNTKGLLAQGRSRPQETYALTAHALKIALENNRSAAALRAYNNLAESAYRMDRYEESLDLYDRGLALARKVGNRFWFDFLDTDRPIPLFLLGRWDAALEGLAERSNPGRALADIIGHVTVIPLIHTNRREADAAERILDTYRRYETSSDVQEVAAWSSGNAALLNARGDHREALAMAERAIASAPAMGADSIMVKIGFLEAVDAGFALGDLDRVRTLTEWGEKLKSIRSSPAMMALHLRAKARLAAAHGDDGADSLFDASAQTLRQMENRFWLAATLAEQGEWFASQGREDEANPLLDEARGIFESVGAVVWLDRLDEIKRAGRPTASAAT
jgi:tetratricopeptide (TPR) repeat protein